MPGDDSDLAPSWPMMVHTGTTARPFKGPSFSPMPLWFMPFQTFALPTKDGWILPLHRHSDPAQIDPTRPPLLCIPGYGMNSFILSYHPTEESMIDHLIGQGWDVWSVNFRGQTGARRTSGPKRIGMKELALYDIPAAIAGVLARHHHHDTLTLIGCSLGAAMAYAYLAHYPLISDSRVATMVAIGGPLQWRAVHPIVEMAFRSIRLADKLPIRGTRRLAQMALPMAARLPDLFSFYLNARHIDISDAKTLIQTIDNPTAMLNGQLARWIKIKNLQVAGLDIPIRLTFCEPRPFLCIWANEDGVVPPATAASALDFFPGAPAYHIVAGSEDAPFAHADLFIAQGAQRMVFEPMERWLRAQHSDRESNELGDA